MRHVQRPPWEAQVLAAEAKMTSGLPASIRKDMGIASYAPRPSSRPPVHSPPAAFEPQAKKQKTGQSSREGVTDMDPSGMCTPPCGTSHIRNPLPGTAKPRPRPRMKSRVESSDDEVEVVDDVATVTSADELVIKKEPVARQGRTIDKGASAGTSAKSSRSRGRAPSVVPESDAEEMQLDADMPNPEDEDDAESLFRPPPRKANIFNRDEGSPPRAVSTPAETKPAKGKTTRQKSAAAKETTGETCAPS